MVKLLLNLSAAVFIRVKSVVLPFEKVMLACTTSIIPLSVTLVATSIISLVLNLLAFSGIKSNTCGRIVSSPTKNVVWVLLMLFCVSFAMNVMLYRPNSVGMVKVLL